MGEVGAVDFEDRGSVTGNVVVNMGLRVGVGIVIGGVQEESMGLVEASDV